MIIALLNLIKKYWLSITLFIFTSIALLSLYPLKTLPPVPGTDKIHHFIAYAVLMFPTALKKPKHWLLISLLFICYSGAIELIQPYVNRYGEFKDFIANVAGLGSGLVIAQTVNYFVFVNTEISPKTNNKKRP